MNDSIAMSAATSTETAAPRTHRRGKAVAAALLGAALLTGAGGTFAKWNIDQSVASSGAITAGNLGLSISGGTWTNQVGPIADINAYRIVPGDVVTFTASATPTLTGDTLKAKMTTAYASSDAANSDLVTSLVFSPVTWNGKSYDGTTNTLVGGTTYAAQPLRFTVTFPATVTGTTGMNQVLNLANIKVILQQV